MSVIRRFRSGAEDLIALSMIAAWLGAIAGALFLSVVRAVLEAS